VVWIGFIRIHKSILWHIVRDIRSWRGWKGVRRCCSVWGTTVTCHRWCPWCSILCPRVVYHGDRRCAPPLSQWHGKWWWGSVCRRERRHAGSSRDERWSWRCWFTVKKISLNQDFDFYKITEIYLNYLHLLDTMKPQYKEGPRDCQKNYARYNKLLLYWGSFYIIVVL